MLDNFDQQSLLLGAFVGPVALFVLKRLVVGYRQSVSSNERDQGLRVVITGSSRGLGLALAAKFLSLGDKVMISSRTDNAVKEALVQLKEQHPNAFIRGKACNVAMLEEVEALAQDAVDKLGGIDLWVNNAALSYHDTRDITESDPKLHADVINTNLLGSIWGSRAAISIMKEQPNGGKVFLLDGTGGWGNPTPKNIAYGATKRGLNQLKDSLAAQLKGSKVSVHMASPGLVATDLLFAAADSPRSAKLINCLAEPPSTVASWLVPRFRGVHGNGKHFSFLTASGALWRLALFRWRKSRFLKTA